MAKLWKLKAIHLLQQIFQSKHDQNKDVLNPLASGFSQDLLVTVSPNFDGSIWYLF